MSPNAIREPAHPTTRAGEYHRVRLPFDPDRAKVWRALCRYLARWVDPQGGLLDLGAGYGDFSRFSEARAKWALDINIQLTGRWGASVRPLIQSALEPLRIPDRSLATVFASNFFEHF